MTRVRWWRWTTVTTAGELAGFVVPATVGATAVTLAWPAGIAGVALLAAGFVEGGVLGYAQATVLRTALPALRVRRFWTATGAAAAVAYAVGLLPSMLGDRLTRLPVPVLVAAGAVAAVLLLGSIGTAQWADGTAGRDRWSRPAVTTGPAAGSASERSLI